MKLYLLVVISSVMLLFLPGVYVKTVFIPCISTTTHSLEEISEIKRLVVPKTRAAKCLYRCMLYTAGVMTKDALIDVQKFMDSLGELSKKTGIKYDEQSLIVTREIMEKCKGHRHSSEDQCETAGFLLHCAVEESVTRGWESTQIIKLIHAIFNASQKIDFLHRFG